MMYRTQLYTLAVIALLVATVSSSSVCTGFPKMYNGKPCASTTRYWDGQMGACGCGTGNTSPFSWQWTKPTAAASAPIFGSGTWCGSGCGKCFKLTPTAVGVSPVGRGAPNTDSVVVKVTNLCPYAGNEQWCAYDVNSYGYDAHFDVMDYNMNGLVTSMGWDNPEVTYEEVDCAANGYVDWGCQCASSSDSPSNPTSSPQVLPTTAPTDAPVVSPTKASDSPTKAPSSPTKAPSSPTKAPSSPTKAPGSPTKVPGSHTKAPGSPTKAPNSHTKAPVSPTTQGIQGQGVQVSVPTGVNQWWFGFSVVNNIAFTKIEAMDSSSLSSWTQMTYQGGSDWNLWSIAPKSGTLQAPLSLRFTTASGKVVIASNIITAITPGTIDTKITV